MDKLVIAWDLDGTLIDSSHRTKVVDGKFDLDYWLANCTREKIFQDSLLPLAKVYFKFKETGFTQICLTARDMNVYDFQFLESHGLEFDALFHRADSKELDEVLKDKKLKEFLKEGGRIPFQAFDDKEENLKVFDKYKFRTFSASYLNIILREDSWRDIKKKGKQQHPKNLLKPIQNLLT